MCSSHYARITIGLCGSGLGSSTHICSTIYLLRSSVALLCKLAVRIGWVKSLWIIYFLFCYGRCVFTLSSYFCWLDIEDQWKPMYGKELKFWTGDFTHIYRFKYSYICICRYTLVLLTLTTWTVLQLDIYNNNIHLYIIAYFMLYMLLIIYIRISYM